MEGRGTPHLPFFENRKKCPDFGRKGPDCIHLWANFSTLNVFLRVSRRKNSKVFPAGPFFLCFWRNVYQSDLIQRNFPWPEKFLVTRLAYFKNEKQYFVTFNTVAFSFLPVFWTHLQCDGLIEMWERHTLLAKNKVNKYVTYLIS